MYLVVLTVYNNNNSGSDVVVVVVVVVVSQSVSQSFCRVVSLNYVDLCRLALYSAEHGILTIARYMHSVTTAACWLKPGLLSR
jgi:hypothetical protein